MNLSALETINQKIASQPSQQKQDAGLRQAAEQFEAILLMQLTSALNNSADDSEDSLFGSDGGTGLAKQMFSEQIAGTMAQSGGIGLADMLMNQFAAKTSGAAEKNTKLETAVSAVKDIKEKSAEPANKPAGVDLSKPADSAAGEQVSRLTRPRIVAETAAPAPLLGGSADVVAPVAESVKFQMPLRGRISSDFGLRFHPIDRVHKFHRGVDIAAPRGTPIGAAADGKVIFAGWNRGYGKTVIIEHPDGRRTRYGHADKLYVEEGDAVQAGQTIGAVGSTGKSTGPHLHFEIIENDRQIDPLDFIAKGLRFPNR
jgi:murein DD-endopeptidase MepM/ murein hydrolase activator NlpD